MDQGSRVRVHVPAKINLFLAVRGRRSDGYHELTTVLQTVDLRDRLDLRLSGPPGQSHHPASRRRMRLQLEADGAQRAVGRVQPRDPGGPHAGAGDAGHRPRGAGAGLAPVPVTHSAC